MSCNQARPFSQESTTMDEPQRSAPFRVAFAACASSAVLYLKTMKRVTRKIQKNTKKNGCKVPTLKKMLNRLNNFRTDSFFDLLFLSCWFSWTLSKFWTRQICHCADIAEPRAPQHLYPCLFRERSPPIGFFLPHSQESARRIRWKRIRHYPPWN